MLGNHVALMTRKVTVWCQGKWVGGGGRFSNKHYLMPLKNCQSSVQFLSTNVVTLKLLEFI